MIDTAERQAQWLRGVLDLAALATLARQGTTYGYVLLQSLVQAGLDDLKGGTLYPLLSRLEKDGLVGSQWQAGEGGPPRKYFTLTPAGQAVLNQGTGGWREFAATITQILGDAPRSDPQGETP